MTDIEKKPLIAAPAPEQLIAVASDSTREWSGHLLSCIGNGDQNGISSCAYVKLLGPLAWGYASGKFLEFSFMEAGSRA